MQSFFDMAVFQRRALQKNIMDLSFQGSKKGALQKNIQQVSLHFPFRAAFKDPSIGVLFGCFPRKKDGDSWFTGCFLLTYQGNPSISPKDTYGSKAALKQNNTHPKLSVGLATQRRLLPDAFGAPQVPRAPGSLGGHVPQQGLPDAADHLLPAGHLQAQERPFFFSSPTRKPRA